MTNKLSSEDLDRIVENQCFHLPYFRAMLRTVEQSFYPREGLPEPVLDVGSGDGHFAWAMLTQQAWFGFDPWLEPSKEAQKYELYHSLIISDAHSLPSVSGHFASALSNSVLEHIPDVQGVLDEVYRALQDGGVFYFAVPNHRWREKLWGQAIFKCLGLKRLASAYERFFNKISRHVNLDAPEVWTERLKQAGFESVETFNYFPVWALRMLERGHAAGLPNLLWKKLFGKWVLFPSRKNPFLRFNKIRKLVDNPKCEDGVCSFIIAKKGAGESCL